MLNCYRGRPSEKPPIHIIPDMDSQPKYEAQEASEFFENGLAMRMPVDGTVSQDHLRENTRFYQGKTESGQWVVSLPIQMTLPLLKRGQERYDIFCAPCHSRTGDGQGIMVNHGYIPPPTFHADRLRDIEDGHIYDVIVKGIRNMPSYAHQVPVNDRWAIVAYVRALQRAQNASLQDIPNEKRETIN
ncbi:cytochrome c [candidate division KSB1 bacterium]|nr:cytochrome c [candidate division KSB1 bacterium]